MDSSTNLPQDNYSDTVVAWRATQILRLRPSDPGYTPWAVAIHRLYMSVEDVISLDEYGSDVEPHGALGLFPIALPEI